MMPDAVSMTEPDVGAVVARLMAGEVFTALAIDSVAERAAALEAVLARVSDEDTRVAWIGNPLRSALTIERMLLQLVGPEIDLRIERTPADLAGLFAARTGAENRLLLVVQQPESIDPGTRETLGEVARHLGEQPVQVQFLFAGSSALRLPEVAPVPLAVSPDRRAARKRWSPELFAIVVLIAGALLAWAATTSPAVQRLRQDFATLPAAMLQDGSPGNARQAFDGLLTDRAAALPPLSAAQKEALYAEFVARLRQGPNRP